MKKKLLSIILCLVMASVLLVGCGKDDEEETEETTVEVAEKVEEEEEEEAEEPEEYTMAEPEELTADPVYHFTFDEPEEGVTTVIQTEDPGVNDGATFGIEESDTYIDRDGNEVAAEVKYQPGPVGNSAYIDGNFGLKFDVEPLETETYTVSFWMNADRLSTYGPTLQFGSNMGMSDVENTVKWINITQTDWGTDGANIFPVVWNRNSETGAWPWVYAADDAIHGKQEWVCVTLVATGNIYTFEEEGIDRNGAKLYLDGTLVFDASEDLYGGLATDIMGASDNFEALFGINYWDTIYKGYIDDLYFFDYSLTDGQVATLYQLGDPSQAEEVAEGGAEDAEEPEVESQTVTTIDESAISTVGVPTTDNAFWTSNTDGYELTDGGTVTMKFNNYSSGINNWDNYVIAFCNTPVTADKLANADNYEGYAEYGVLRSDAFGWGFATENGELPADSASFTWEWDNFLEIMKDAAVTAKISRSGSDVTVNATVVAADGTEYTYDVTAPTTAEASDPMYVFLTGEASYIELLSVE